MPESLQPESSIALWAAAPFALLVLAIALGPLAAKRWWDKYYPAVAVGLGALTVSYYLLVLHSGGPLIRAGRDYVSFIALVGSLYVVAGGIHIRVHGRATPLRNVLLLAIGAVAANLVGTTGASMILIRPYLRVNRYRIKPFHVVFFIFVVSNIGGVLTPVGDPPLFLGYLKGVPFFWPLETLWSSWAIAIGIVLSVFYLLDRRDFHHMSRTQQERTEEIGEHGEVVGLHNLIFLAIVLVAVFVTDPPFIRELLMLTAAAGSYLTTRAEIHKKNEFNFLPVQEVAILFLGIFATMVPALEWIQQNSAGLGFARPEQFFWSAGALSSVLDNAPTYLNFFSAAIGLFVPHGAVAQVQQYIARMIAGNAAGTGIPLAPEVRNTLAILKTYHPDMLALGKVTADQIAAGCLLATQPVVVQAISVGAVFFGAMTYIGNGPNLMVKSIAEQAGATCPSFGGYVIRFAFPILLPTFAIVWLLFFH